MESKPQPTINLDALAFAFELSEAEFRDALRDIRGKLRFGRRIVPTIGDVLERRRHQREREGK